MKPQIILLASSALLLAAGACIREDLSGCRSTNVLLLSYKGDENAEIFNDKVSQVEIFVFSAEGQLVYTGILPPSDVEGAKTVLPTLDPGDYTIVCFGNTYDTSIPQLVEGAFSESLVGPAAQFGRGEVNGTDSLYFSSKEFIVTDYDATDTLLFKSAHYKVAVDVLADGQIVEALASLRVSGLSPYTDFSGTPRGAPVTYQPLLTESNEKACARFNIMRNSSFDDVEVVLSTTAEVEIARINVGDFLRAHPEIDISKQECLIPIQIRFTSAGIEIMVPEWYGQQIIPEF